MPRGIPNNPTKQTSQSKPRRRRKLIPSLPEPQSLMPMEAVAASPRDSRRQRDFAIVTFRSGTLKGSVVEKIREDLADLNIKAIFVEHENWDGHAVQTPQVAVQSVYN